MSEDTTRSLTITFLTLSFILVSIFLCAIIVQRAEDNHYWRKELIERGHAEYNQTTGKWQWKEEE